MPNMNDIQSMMGMMNSQLGAAYGQTTASQPVYDNRHRSKLPCTNYTYEVTQQGCIAMLEHLDREVFELRQRLSCNPVMMSPADSGSRVNKPTNKKLLLINK